MTARPSLAATAPITVQVVVVAFVRTAAVAASLRWLGRRAPLVDRPARRVLDAGASIPTLLAVLLVWKLFIVTEELWLLPFRWVRLTDDPLRSIARTIVPGTIVALVPLPIAQ